MKELLATVVILFSCASPPESKWISVNDSLPPTNSNDIWLCYYICQAEDTNNKPPYAVTQKKIGIVWRSFGEWETGGLEPDNWTVIITHWQPLPEPPKE